MHPRAKKPLQNLAQSQAGDLKTHEFTASSENMQKHVLSLQREANQIYKSLS
jgi:hypothetical protein